MTNEDHSTGARRVLALCGTNVLGFAFGSETTMMSGTLDVRSQWRQPAQCRARIRARLDELAQLDPTDVIWVSGSELSANRFRGDPSIPDLVESWRKDHNLPVRQMHPKVARQQMGLRHKSTQADLEERLREIGIIAASNFERLAVAAVLSKFRDTATTLMQELDLPSESPVSILAIDLGHNVGFALGQSGFQVSTTFTQCDVDTLVQQLDRARTALNLERVVMNAKQRYRGRANRRSVLRLAAAVARWCIDAGLPFEFVPRSASADAWTSGEASQDAVMAEAVRRGFKPSSQAEANALALFDFVQEREARDVAA